MTAKRGFAPVAHAELYPAQLEGHLEHDVGEIREIVGELLDGERARQILSEQAEDLRVMRLAQPIHLAFLVALPGGELAPEFLSESFPVRPREQGARGRAARRARSDAG